MKTYHPILIIPRWGIHEHIPALEVQGYECSVCIYRARKELLEVLSKNPKPTPVPSEESKKDL